VGTSRGTGAQLREVGRVAQRLEHAAVVEQVGEINVGRGAVLEADVRGVSVERLGLNE